MKRRLSPTVLTAGGLGLLLALALTLGAVFGWPWAVRLVIVAGVLVLAVALLLVRVVRADRSAKGIEQALKTQADLQRQGARPDRQGEIRQLHEQFDRALKTLKESKLVRGRRGSE